MADDPSTHDYLSAGDATNTDGDRPYTGCFLCGRPRGEHRDAVAPGVAGAHAGARRGQLPR